MIRTPVRSATALALASLALVAAPASGASTHQRADRLTPRTHFTMAPDGSSGTTQRGAGIPNIDSVKSTIRTYYGATKNDAGQYAADKDSSPYISEVADLENSQWPYLVHAYFEAKDAGKNPALVLDTDDTTLWTYDMEDGAMHFDYDPGLQDEYVQNERFPATPGMVRLVQDAAALGYQIFGLTGRHDDQQDATLANLEKVGYTDRSGDPLFTADHFFTKWGDLADKPGYVDCTQDGDASCSTVEYKADTRKHIAEDLGYDIVLNAGDQWSDLQGGYADRTLKLPNPTYFLASPDLDGTPADRQFSPRRHFTMAPDGSSGATEGGEGIPNVDVVKSTIRTYYDATEGIADKDTSPYIAQMNRISHYWAPRVRHRCHVMLRRHHRHPGPTKRPAVVFDADDTTLWTYDMEDGAMHFNFDPQVQNDQWVQPERFPATPHMRRVVRAADQGGCRVFGLTGRHDDQKHATIGNLAKFYQTPHGDRVFRPRFYYTKWNSDAAPPSYIHCADPTSCTTIEYKSQTRRRIEQHRHFQIAFNFGDQFSDLVGGHARRTVKLPNPTYYLP